MNELFASLYESQPFGFYDPTFSQEVFDAYLYQKYGLVLIISTLITVFVYYKALDKPSLAKIGIWISVLLITVLFNFGYSLVDSEIVLAAKGLEFDNEYTSLAICSAIYCAILFVILSLLVKKISINNSKVPF